MVAPVPLRELLRRGWERRHPSDGLRHVAGASDATPLSPARRLRKQLFARVLSELDAEGLAAMHDAAAVRARTRRVLIQALEERGAAPLSPAERERLESELVAELTGLGPLEPLFADPTISDVLVNGPDEVWVDRFGKLERTDVRFDDEDHLRRLLMRMVSAHGRHLDEASPMVDVRLADGSRERKSTRLNSSH